MLKIIIFIFVVYVIFKILKMLFGMKKAAEKGKPKRSPFFTQAPRQINEMVQDPVCKIYIPKKDALHLEHGGSRYYFCCHSCLDAFQSREKER